MIEIVVHLVTAFYFPATEYIYIITCRIAYVDNSVKTGLVGKGFRFTEIDLTIRNRLIRNLFASRRIQGTQLKGMVAFHDGIRRDTVHTNRVMRRELTVVFQVIQSLIQGFSDTCIRPEHVALSIQFHADAIGVHVITFTAVQ